MKRTYYVLAAILLLALFLRVGYLDKPFLGEEAIFIEAAQQMAANQPPSYFINALNRGTDTLFILHPPLYIFSLSVIFQFIQSGFEVVSRSFSVILGLGSVLLTFLLGRKLFDEKTGHFASFFMAISAFAVWQSQWIDIDGSVLTFLALLYSLTFLEWKEQDDSITSLALTVCTALVFLSKLAGVLIIGSFLLFLLARKQFKDFAKLAVINAIGFVFFIAELAGISAAHHADFLGGAFSNSAAHFFMSNAPIFNQYYLLAYGGMMLLMLTPSLVAAMMMNARSVVKDFMTEKRLILVVWIAVFLGFYFTLKGPWYRYLMPALPAFFILAASYMKDLDVMKKLRVILPVSLTVFALCWGFGVRSDLVYLKSFGSIPLMLLLSIPLMIGVYGFFTPKKKELLTVVLLSIFIGSSLYGAIDLTMGLNSPDFNRAATLSADYIIQNNISDFVASVDTGYYAKRPYYEIRNAFINESFDYSGKYVFWTPIYANSGEMETLFEIKCAPVESFTSQNVVTGIIYRC